MPTNILNRYPSLEPKALAAALLQAARDAKVRHSREEVEKRLTWAANTQYKLTGSLPKQQAEIELFLEPLSDLDRAKWRSVAFQLQCFAASDAWAPEDWHQLEDEAEELEDVRQFWLAHHRQREEEAKQHKVERDTAQILEAHVKSFKDKRYPCQPTLESITDTLMQAVRDYPGQTAEHYVSKLDIEDGTSQHVAIAYDSLNHNLIEGDDVQLRRSDGPIVTRGKNKGKPSQLFFVADPLRGRSALSLSKDRLANPHGLSQVTISARLRRGMQPSAALAKGKKHDGRGGGRKRSLGSI